MNCHTKLHNGWWVGISTHPDTILSIIEHGEEDVYDLEMEAPFHNFVADGFVVHNSTRYCNYAKGKFGGEITVIRPCFWEEGSEEMARWQAGVAQAERTYLDMLASGAKPEQARSVLPNSLKTEIVVTANLREIRHILRLRTSKAAHPQMRELMVPLLLECQARIPVIFDDIRPG